MKYSWIFILCFLLNLPSNIFSQDIRWYDPSDKIEDQIPIFNFSGQGWNHNALESPFQRLPLSAKKEVRNELWKLSRFSTGITINFSTDASTIYVRYKVEDYIQKPHRAATGLSGIDLYVTNQNHETPFWCKGKFQFGDTIVYTFGHLNSMNVEHVNSDYQLYLPMSCAIDWLEIGIPENATLSGIEKDIKLPIVVYGTSIVQGSAASRPGMAWTSILQRNLDREIINLGFAGNGRMEPEIIKYIADIKASIYVIDCLPNLIGVPNQELAQKMEMAAKMLKKVHPKTPILFVQHPGFPQELVNKSSLEKVKSINDLLEINYLSLRKIYSEGIYLLSKNEIDMCMDCTVEGTHPTDLGMNIYAEAYSRKIREIFDFNQKD
ncbi:hydrolase [Maribellus comscasis]|uniref:Hydrolase n=1 Tax=Maribellus comscasis TaxID=2681766 RepID=A0A6I6K2U3_9BACT|nr:SGNH/GDSL hydrolase family protein [Maribellus comscasis]QGY47730.1 hydrolase [Maribellus comscasis]